MSHARVWYHAMVPLVWYHPQPEVKQPRYGLVKSGRCQPAALHGCPMCLGSLSEQRTVPLSLDSRSRRVPAVLGDSPTDPRDSCHRLWPRAESSSGLGSRAYHRVGLEHTVNKIAVGGDGRRVQPVPKVDARRHFGFRFPPVVHYTSSRQTKDFIEQEAARLEPGFKRKSGTRYLLIRWLEEQLRTTSIRRAPINATTAAPSTSRAQGRNGDGSSKPPRARSLVSCPA